MTEPFFIKKFTQSVTPDRKRQWIQSMNHRAISLGAQWVRFSMQPNGAAMLFEGWMSRPDDQGDPRWHLAAEDDGGEAIEFADQPEPKISPHCIIDYTNWRGERSKRLIVPVQIQFTSNEWHMEPQWLLEAYDVAKGDHRTFAMRSIHSWEPVSDAEDPKG